MRTCKLEQRNKRCLIRHVSKSALTSVQPMNGGAEKEFGTPSHVLYLNLALQGKVSASVLLLVNEHYRSPRSRIFRPLTCIVFPNTSANVCRVTCVQSVI